VAVFTKAYYGMEWKEKIGMEYGMAQVWNVWRQVDGATCK